MDSDSDDDLPPGWEERATADGNIYFVNHISRSTQWIHPRTGKKKYVSRELPFGWKKIVDSEGKITFHNEVTEVTTHSDPRLAFAIERDKSNDDIRYKFDASSTALEVLHGVDLSNKVAIVTGSNTGIGFETALSLAMHDCTVVLACRSVEKANAAIAKILSRRSKAKCLAIRLDLASLKSVKQFVEDFKARYEQLDILILNAGVFGMSHSLTEDGYETTFQVSHLGHFYLTTLLEPLIMRSLATRIVIVSSESHRFSNLSSENMTEEMLSPPANKFSFWSAYNDVKLCNILFANELHARWYAKGVNVYAVHPGNLVFTDLSRHSFLLKILFYLCRPFTKSLQQGASTTIFCATYLALSSVSGVYFNNCFPCMPSTSALNGNLSKKLWILSENLVKKAFLKEDYGKEATVQQ